jgi:hypothetical protein
MPILGNAGIAPALNLILGPAITDQFRRTSPLLGLLPYVPVANGSATWAVKFATRAQGGAVADGSSIADAAYDSDTRAQASLPWATYRAGAGVAFGALDTAAASGGAFNFGGNLRLLADELRDASTKIRADVGAHLYSGNASASPAQVGGLATAVGTADYAGLAVLTHPTWIGQVDTHAASSFTLDAVRTKLLTPVAKQTGRYPDVVVTTFEIMDLLKKEFDDSADTTVTISTANGEINLYKHFGSRAVVLDGVPFIADPYCTASTLYALSLDALEIQYVPAITGALSGATPAEVQSAVQMLTQAYIPMSEIEQAMMTPAQFGPVITPQGIDGLRVRYDLRTPQMQLVPRRRNALGKLTLT